MLEELPDVSQRSGEPFRRWFADQTFDLIVWHEEDRTISGFQLCYRFDGTEKAVTWFRDRGFMHNRVDDGESVQSHYKMTPVLVADGDFQRDRVLGRFRMASRRMDEEVARVVADRLEAYPKV